MGGRPEGRKHSSIVNPLSEIPKNLGPKKTRTREAARERNDRGSRLVGERKEREVNTAAAGYDGGEGSFGYDKKST